MGTGRAAVAYARKQEVSWLAVGVGAVLGAWLRWGASILLGAYQNQLPLGTLLANLAGGYLAGLAVAFFEAHPVLPIEWRLLVITGFLWRADDLFHFFRRSDGASAARPVWLVPRAYRVASMRFDYLVYRWFCDLPGPVFLI